MKKRRTSSSMLAPSGGTPGDDGEAHETSATHEEDRGFRDGRPIPIAQTVPAWLAVGMRREHRTCLPLQRVQIHGVASENRPVYRGVMGEAVRGRFDDQNV